LYCKFKSDTKLRIFFYMVLEYLFQCCFFPGEGFLTRIFQMIEQAAEMVINYKIKQTVELWEIISTKKLK
jgi:hypothetical protein